MTAWAAGGLADAGGLDNPYAGVDWETVECLHSMSHQHGEWSDLRTLWDMGFRHFPLSNYYPSRPRYPIPDEVLREYPEALGAPNAEHHGGTDNTIHWNALGSFYVTGSGRSWSVPREAPASVEHVFSNLTVFDPGSPVPGEGIYRLEARLAAPPGRDAAAILTVEGATAVHPGTFEPVGDGRIAGRRITAQAAKGILLRADADRMRVCLAGDPADTRVTHVGLMQGTHRPWRQAFREALDGTRTDGSGRPVEGLLDPQGGGITINHPHGGTAALAAMLDFDPRVLGIEVWNSHVDFGRAGSLRCYRLWDELLASGRRCLGFFVKDHFTFRQGRNVLLVPPAAGRPREDRERDALRAYRRGAFFGLLGAMATNAAGAPCQPYDHSPFRFTRLALSEASGGAPRTLEVAVAGADAVRRPVLQIRFVTDQGIVQRTDGQTRAVFPIPAGCRYVRVEAFACPAACGGVSLTPERLGAMTVGEIADLHDRRDAGERPIPVADMIFSQPIRFAASPRDAAPVGARAGG